MRGADKEAQHNDQKNTLLKQQQLRQIFSETSLTSSRDVGKVLKILVGFNKLYVFHKIHTHVVLSSNMKITNKVQCAQFFRLFNSVKRQAKVKLSILEMA